MLYYNYPSTSIIESSGILYKPIESMELGKTIIVMDIIILSMASVEIT